MPNGRPVDRDALEALLRFYAEAGVDLALSEAPVDRFAQSLKIAETTETTGRSAAPR